MEKIININFSIIKQSFFYSNITKEAQASLLISLQSISLTSLLPSIGKETKKDGDGNDNGSWINIVSVNAKNHFYKYRKQTKLMCIRKR